MTIAQTLSGCRKTAECHSGAQALLASPEPKNTDPRNQGLGQCSWVPGLALKGHPGTTAEFFRPLLVVTALAILLSNVAAAAPETEEEAPAKRGGILLVLREGRSC